MDPQHPVRRTVVRASAWTVPAVVVAVTAPAVAASTSAADLRFDVANVFPGDYDQARPRQLVSHVQVQNSYYPGAPTVTSLVLTVSYPQSAVSGAAATLGAGVGWSYTSVVSSGAQWVYRFDWVGSAAPGASTGLLKYAVPILMSPYPAGQTVTLAFTATASGDTAVASDSYTIPVRGRP